MKKKLMICLLALITVFVITGCEPKKEKSNNNNNSSNEIKENSNSVVLYFSATGTTKKLLKELQKNLIAILLK